MLPFGKRLHDYNLERFSSHHAIHGKKEHYFYGHFNSYLKLPGGYLIGGLGHFGTCADFSIAWEFHTPN